MRGRLLVVSLAVCALVLGAGWHATFSAFTAGPVRVGGSSFRVATLGSFVAVAPGSDVQPGTATPLASGGADALSVDLGTVPSARTFSSVFTVTNRTSQTLPLRLTPTLPPQVAAVRFAASGASTVSLAPGASSAVQIQTSGAAAGAGTGSIRLGRSDMPWLYRDYPLHLVEAPEAPPALTATARAAGKVALAWSATPTASGVAGYVVYRRVGGGPLAQLATVTGTAYTDAQTVDGTAYAYVVRAAAASPAGVESLDSPTATATADATPPPAPAGVALASGSTWVNAAGAAAVSVRVSCSAGSSASDTLTLTVTDPAGATNTTTAAACAGAGAVALGPLDLRPLADGTLTLSVTSADAAGNVSAATTATVQKDTVAPALGASYVDGKKTDAVAGQSEPGLVVSVDQTAPSASGPYTATVAADGSFSIAVATVDGKRTQPIPVAFTATVTDAAGNRTQVAVTGSDAS